MLTLLGMGCASPGQPQPPSLELPEPARKVTAERVGDRVRVAWTTPENTTDGVRIRGPLTAVICLDGSPTMAAPTAQPARKPSKSARKRAAGNLPTSPLACDAVKRVPVTAVGPDETEVDLTQASGPPTLVAFAIELQNEKMRSAGLSQPAYVAAGAGPNPVGKLNISARRDGVLVRWNAVADAGTMELKRTLVATAEGPVASGPATLVKRAKPAPSAASKGPAREVVLRADGDSRGDGPDTGGMVDGSVVDGSTYAYVAQRVRVVTLAGHTLEMRSVPSPVATFTYHDVFPPQAPTGLVLVPGGGFGETPSIDLAWDANPEADVLGYNVYRREGTGAFVRVTPDPVPAPAFRDPHVHGGAQYTYRVTAVDERHNESAPSAEQKESLRK